MNQGKTEREMSDENEEGCSQQCKNQSTDRFTEYDIRLTNRSREKSFDHQGLSQIEKYESRSEDS